MSKYNLTDSKRFSLVAKHAFTPVYPYLAQQIKEKFGINKGVCVDIGSGPGHLAIAIAGITDLQVFSLDVQPDMTETAQANIAKAGLSNRILTITADVCRMPFDDNSVDLVVSRGSIFFWKDRPAACAEIYRILKPDGVAYCGGGMGNSQIRTQVMESIDHDEALRKDRGFWLKKIGSAASRLDPEALVKALAESGIRATAEYENDGIWIQIIK